MLRNASKGLQTLEELGWTLLPPGDTDAWDGMRGWFVEYLGQHQQHLSNGMIRRWYRVASAGG
jgi:hypothetical protein